MPTPSIVATGSITPANAGGIAKLYVSGETVTFTDPANPAPSVELWELISAPPGQTSVILNPTTSTPTLVLDADPGTFRVRHTADGDVGELLIAIPTAAGERIPCYRERDSQDASPTEAVWNEAGNTQGYYPAMHSAIKLISPSGAARRVATDASDLLIFEGDVDVSGDLINTGSAGPAVFTKIGTPEDTLVGFFDKAVGVVPHNAANHYSGGSGVEPSTQITVSLWILRRDTVATQHWFTKPAHNPQASPFQSVGLSSTTTQWNFLISVGGVRYFTVADILPPEHEWTHVGGTYDSVSGDLRAYMNGRLIGIANSGGGVIDYQSSPDWFFGDLPGGATENAFADFSDVRVADVVRPASWFEEVWRKGFRLT